MGNFLIFTRSTRKHTRYKVELSLLQSSLRVSLQLLVKLISTTTAETSTNVAITVKPVIRAHPLVSEPGLNT